MKKITLLLSLCLLTLTVNAKIKIKRIDPTYWYAVSYTHLTLPTKA